MIADCDIPGADPAAVVEQYDNLIKKIANKYNSVLQRSGVFGFDDLCQVGRITVIDAQKKYEPSQCSFSTFIYNRIRSAMRNTLGFNSKTGEAPAELVYLDEPLSNGEDITLADTIADADALPLVETITDKETTDEITIQVREAVERMKSDKQKNAITMVWIEGKTREQAAEKMEMQYKSFCALEKYSRGTLRKDEKLRRFVMTEIPLFQVGARQFRSTWTSAVEKAVIWRDIHIFGNNMPEEWAAGGRYGVLDGYTDRMSV